nr:hypothetical protein [Tanacetum cinerariifolium]
VVAIGHERDNPALSVVAIVGVLVHQRARSRRVTIHIEALRGALVGELIHAARHDGLLGEGELPALGIVAVVGVLLHLVVAIGLHGDGPALGVGAIVGELLHVGAGRFAPVIHVQDLVGVLMRGRWPPGGFGSFCPGSGAIRIAAQYPAAVRPGAGGRGAGGVLHVVAVVEPAPVRVGHVVAAVALHHIRRLGV